MGTVEFGLPNRSSGLALVSNTILLSNMLFSVHRIANEQDSHQCVILSRRLVYRSARPF